jgi:hypothetical protein
MSYVKGVYIKVHGQILREVGHGGCEAFFKLYIVRILVFTTRISSLTDNPFGYRTTRFSKSWMFMRTRTCLVALTRVDNWNTQTRREITLIKNITMSSKKNV